MAASVVASFETNLVRIVGTSEECLLAMRMFICYRRRQKRKLLGVTL